MSLSEPRTHANMFERSQAICRARIVEPTKVAPLGMMHKQSCDSEGFVKPAQVCSDPIACIVVVQRSTVTEQHTQEDNTTQHSSSSMWVHTVTRTAAVNLVSANMPDIWCVPLTVTARRTCKVSKTHSRQGRSVKPEIQPAQATQGLQKPQCIRTKKARW